jgi:aminopeptidase N
LIAPQVGTAAVISINSTNASRRFRACYVPPTHLIPTAQLSFDIKEDVIRVTSTLTIVRNPEWQGFLQLPAAAAAAHLGCGSLPGNADSMPATSNSSSKRKQEVVDEGAVVVAPDHVPPLVLNGEGLTLLDIKLDGEQQQQFDRAKGTASNLWPDRRR